MSGSSFSACLALFALLSVPALPGEKKKPEAFAVVAGTVFRDPGFALPEAKVTLLSKGGKPKKLQEAVTTYRGEFSFRVPPKEATYVIKAAMKGFRPEEKEAAIAGEDRVEVNLVLIPESK
jgi:hypothetical protein